MNARQRVMDAVNHKTTDRIPITFDAEIEVYEALYQNLNISSKEQLFDRLNVDTWMILPKNFIYPELMKCRHQDHGSQNIMPQSYRMVLRFLCFTT